MSKNILVIGSINVDYVTHTDRLPKLGETIMGSDFAMNFGGKGANQAVAIAKSGCAVKMLGAVGKDLSGDLAIKNLESFGVDTSSLIKADAPTGAAAITVCGGDNHIILEVGANAYVTPALIDENAELFDWADIVVMQYEIPTESVLHAARVAKQKGKTVILNPAPVKEVCDELYGYIDWIIPNEFEAQLITGIEQNNDTDAEAAMARLRDMGAGNAIITLGKRGCAYHNGDSISYAGIFDVKRVDTTSAGDSFIGGFCSALCEGKSIDDAVYYASAVSSITIGRAGASVSIPTADEVKDFLSKNTMQPRD
ncbi:MAG: ribokinase [Clostridia bacterium]|nr:ribokinase [Clostridia bacterium]